MKLGIINKSYYSSSYFIFVTFLLVSTFIRTSFGKYTLVWSDDFNGKELDREKWYPLIDCSGRGNNELQCYTDRKKNIQVFNGSLILTAFPEYYKERDYTSGRVHAKGPGWLYGRFEARARVPKGKHLWPAIWMVPSIGVYGPWPKSGEIDIMELRGQNSDTLEGTIHYGYSREVRGKMGSGNLIFPFDFSSEFHTFVFEWTNKSMTWFVDGHKFYHVSTDRMFLPPATSSFTPSYPKDKKDQDKDSYKRGLYTRKGQPFDQPFKWILNVAVGGGYFPRSVYGDISPIEAKRWEKPFMEVDWVRVYQDVPEKVRNRKKATTRKPVDVKQTLIVNDKPTTLRGNAIVQSSSTVTTKLPISPINPEINDIETSQESRKTSPISNLISEATTIIPTTLVPTSLHSTTTSSITKTTLHMPSSSPSSHPNMKTETSDGTRTETETTPTETTKKVSVTPPMPVVSDETLNSTTTHELFATTTRVPTTLTTLTNTSVPATTTEQLIKLTVVETTMTSPLENSTSSSITETSITSNITTTSAPTTTVTSPMTTEETPSTSSLQPVYIPEKHSSTTSTESPKSDVDETTMSAQTTTPFLLTTETISTTVVTEIPEDKFASNQSSPSVTGSVKTTIPMTTKSSVNITTIQNTTPTVISAETTKSGNETESTSDSGGNSTIIELSDARESYTNISEPTSIKTETFPTTSIPPTIKTVITTTSLPPTTLITNRVTMTNNPTTNTINRTPTVSVNYTVSSVSSVQPPKPTETTPSTDTVNDEEEESVEKDDHGSEETEYLDNEHEASTTNPPIDSDDSKKKVIDDDKKKVINDDKVIIVTVDGDKITVNDRVVDIDQEGHKSDEYDLNGQITSDSDGSMVVTTGDPNSHNKDHKINSEEVPIEYVYYYYEDEIGKKPSSPISDDYGDYP